MGTILLATLYGGLVGFPDVDDRCPVDGGAVPVLTTNVGEAPMVADAAGGGEKTTAGADDTGKSGILGRERGRVVESPAAVALCGPGAAREGSRRGQIKVLSPAPYHLSMALCPPVGRAEVMNLFFFLR